nr:hypothetical protein CFP56_51860 [Quercus suber]
MFCLSRSIDEALIEFKKIRVLRHELCKIHSLKVLIILEMANNCVDKVESCRRCALVFVAQQADQSNYRKVQRQACPVVDVAGN